MLNNLKISKKKIFSLALSLMVIAGCNNPMQSNPSSETFKPVSELELKTISDKKISDANTKFGINLFNELFEEDGKKNLFISPLSVSFALAMTYNGAKEETKAEMAKALELEDLSLEDVNKKYNILLRALINLDPDVKLNIANSLWANKDTAFNETFLNNNTEFFKASVDNVDFSKPETLTKINKWVSDNTQGKIDKILEQIDPQTLLILINAIYFKGEWTEKFEKELTKDQTFNLLDGKTKNIPMMNRYGKYSYINEDKFQAVRLPYGDSKKIAMSVFVPSEDSSLVEFSENLSSENLNNWLSRLTNQVDGNVTLPKFKIEYEKELNDYLKKLGMEKVFVDTESNLTGMFKDANGFISEVKHKSFVEVNEEGTEAAAATSVGVVATSVPLESFKFVADRPFFFVISDNETDTVLFMGSVVNPE